MQCRHCCLWLVEHEFCHGSASGSTCTCKSKQCDSGILLAFEAMVSTLAVFQFPSGVETGCALLPELLHLGRTPTCMAQPALAAERRWRGRKKNQHLLVPSQFRVSGLTEYCYTSKYFSLNSLSGVTMICVVEHSDRLVT